MKFNLDQALTHLTHLDDRDDLGDHDLNEAKRTLLVSIIDELQLHELNQDTDALHTLCVLIMTECQSDHREIYTGNLYFKFIEFLVPLSVQLPEVFQFLIGNVSQRRYPDVLLSIFDRHKIYDVEIFYSYLALLKGGYRCYSLNSWSVICGYAERDHTLLEPFFEACFYPGSPHLKQLVSWLSRSGPIHRGWLVLHLVSQLEHHQHQEEWLSITAARILGHCREEREEITPVLLERIQQESTTQLSYALIHALGQLAPLSLESRAVLILLLKQGDPILLPGIINTLGACQATLAEVAPLLIQQYDHDTSAVRESCIRNLGKLSQVDVVYNELCALLNQALSDRSSSVRRAAAMSCLRLEIYSPEIGVALKPLLKSQSIKTRWIAGQAWGYQDLHRSRAELAEMLRDERIPTNARLAMIITHPSTPRALKLWWTQEKMEEVMKYSYDDRDEIPVTDRYRLFYEWYTLVCEDLLRDKLRYLKGELEWRELVSQTERYVKDVAWRCQMYTLIHARRVFMSQMRAFGSADLQGTSRDLSRTCVWISSIALDTYFRSRRSVLAPEARYQVACDELQAWLARSDSFN